MTQPPLLPPSSPFPVQRLHSNATAAMVLGIVGLTVVPGVGIIAWIMGVKALEEIDAHPEAGWTNREHAKVGKLTGIVGTVYFVGLILFICCYVGFIIALAGASSTY